MWKRHVHVSHVSQIISDSAINIFKHYYRKEILRLYHGFNSKACASVNLVCTVFVRVCVVSLRRIFNKSAIIRYDYYYPLAEIRESGSTLRKINETRNT